MTPTNVITRDQLRHTRQSHELIGSEHGVPVSLILVMGRRCIRIPMRRYSLSKLDERPFRVDDGELVGAAGQIVVAPANATHGFTNTVRALRLTAIHTAPAFDTT